MTGAEWAAVLAGIATIAWVNWYFFVAGKSKAVAAAPGGGAGGVSSVTIRVEGGYDPASIRVTAGQPVRLVFDRRDKSGCSEEVVLPDFGIKKFLPTGEPVTIEVTPPKPGRYEFMCGMSMLRGEIIAE